MIEGMPGTLLERIWFTCRHEFSWPRRAEDGSYYQICLQCGTRYRYDWSTMKRVSRLEAEAEDEPSAAEAKKPVRKCNGNNRWQPRERRLRISVPVVYRVKGSSEWVHGTSENISRSGLLFTTTELAEPGTMVELIFEMPAEICGAAAANV
jgi:hypothetical protein